jgi:hypothetical protein
MCFCGRRTPNPVGWIIVVEGRQVLNIRRRFWYIGRKFEKNNIATSGQ